MQIHAQTAYLFVGFLYVALPIVTWTILRDSEYRPSVKFWCLGTILYGIALWLIGLRDQVPAWISFQVANPLAYAGWALMILAMRRAAAVPGRQLRLAGIWLLTTLGYLLALHSELADGLRLLFSTLVHLAASLTVAAMAWRLFRVQRLKSAALLSGAYLLFALTLVVRILAVSANWREAKVFAPSIDLALTAAAGLIAALYGNLGYTGMALESSRARQLERSADLVREQERRAQVELRARELSDHLQEREALLQQREELLASLAHEVRQPLNNAMAALQSARRAIEASDLDRRDMGLRIQRAADVLRQVGSTVDNTLADAVLLTSTEPLEHEDVDVDTLIKIAVGDLGPGDRERIQVLRESATRTASMHPGLMRLALRNLLSNALNYSEPRSAVTVHVGDCDEPLALVIEIADNGPGLPEALLPRLFTRGARAGNARIGHSHGLGLSIVRRVMDLHHGSVSVVRNDASGTTFQLLIPQDDGLPSAPETSTAEAGGAAQDSPLINAPIP